MKGGDTDTSSLHQTVEELATVVREANGLLRSAGALAEHNAVVGALLVIAAIIAACGTLVALVCISSTAYYACCRPCERCRRRGSCLPRAVVSAIDLDEGDEEANETSETNEARQAHTPSPLGEAKEDDEGEEGDDAKDKRMAHLVLEAVVLNGAQNGATRPE
jgi:hypothetical protein